METDYLFKYLDQHTLDPLCIEMAPTDKGSKEHDNQKHTYVETQVHPQP